MLQNVYGVRRRRRTSLQPAVVLRTFTEVMTGSPDREAHFHLGIQRTVRVTPAMQAGLTDRV